MRTNILIVDDDPNILKTVSQQLTALGYYTQAAADGAAAREQIVNEEIHLVLLDLGLPDINGLDLLKTWRKQDLTIPIIVISGTATIPDAVEAMKQGAADFLVKPIDMQILEAVVKRTLSSLRLKSENKRLRQLTRAESVEFVGESAMVNALLRDATKVAVGDSPVLLEGETGTGKQVLARFIHAHSDQRDEPFVTVNCAAITESLFESELFGHEKGAFTGAFNRKPGKLELVGRGTLFLDEIGELPLLCQAKLLTAIEDRVFERVGGIHSLEFEGRVLAATNRDIQTEIKEGRFRKDLYFRLNTFHLKLPPLRERPEDIPIYLAWAATQCSRRFGKTIPVPSVKVVEQLKLYSWPGNVRELLHHVERVALMAEDAEISSSAWLSIAQQIETADDSTEEDLRAAIEIFKKRHILRIVSSCAGNQTEAAKRLGIERTHLNRLLAQYEGRRQS